MDCIFVLQVRRSGDRKDHEMYREKRNIGWYDTFEEAENSLKSNPAVFSDDGYYKVALIEKVPKGPYSIGINGDEFVRWYKLDGDSRMESFNAKYVDAPELLKPGVIGLTMG